MNIAFNMGFGRYLHYTIDLILLSMVLAGLKKTTGYELKGLPFFPFSSPESKSYLYQYLSIGEHCFNFAARMVRSSAYFRPKRITEVKDGEDLGDVFKAGVNNLVDQASAAAAAAAKNSQQ
ncbi:unnamed protein product [Ambrosiozyma monospora]|uniref:Unnamed protein product n=1 Tax=Ambrosiozyma monospora TaxID=43982 RepID=A0A9W6YS80_AMBMO|nr:unnamed protein product [Ambrosiozyma monospora]